MNQQDQRKGILGEPGGCNHTMNLGCLMLIVLIVALWLCGVFR